MESSKRSRFDELLREAEKGDQHVSAVTDDQVATLRAQLAGDYDEHRHLLANLDSTGTLSCYTALVTAAFIEAVDRRFGPERSDDVAVIEFIGDVRSRFPGADDQIDPAAAERVVRKALGRGSVSDLEGTTIRRIERLLLPVMVADERLGDEELDRFLANASFSITESPIITTKRRQ